MDLITNLADAAWPLRWWALTITAGLILATIRDHVVHGGAR